jgi:hypothetical protein
LEGAVRSACYAAIASKPSFEQQGLPAYDVFARQMTNLTLEMSEVWPLFSGLTKLWQQEIQTQGVMGGLGTTALSEKGARINWQIPFTGLPRQSSKSAAQQRLRESRGKPTLDLEVPDLPMPGMDQPMSGMSVEQQAMPAGLTMPMSDSSPRFQGDDVDMIFHNLAYLDTTDWTNNRERGLQDFGFADESAFQDFCNDPERMVPSSGTPFGPPVNEATGNFWTPPGFLPGHFGEPDPQVEASQILQSLSNTDPDPTLPEGVGW